MGQSWAGGYFWAGLIVMFGLGVTCNGHAADKEQLPVPRFVSMRHGDVNLRVGPGTRYPVAWVFTKQNMPVEITQEFDTWRKIRDWEGTEGWVNAAALQGRRYIIVTGEIRAIRSNPASDGGLVAQVEPGVLGQLEKCPTESPEWCRVEVGAVRGWIRRNEIWGIYDREFYPAS